VSEGTPAAVLDASALMAVLHAEDGASVVVGAIGEGAAVSVVNWAEVLSKLAEAGKDPALAAADAAPGRRAASRVVD
jgi:PIN domain nuclease of toxin-antitoxin system